MNHRKLIFTSFLSIFIIACSGENDDNGGDHCGEGLIINDELYQSIGEPEPVIFILGSEIDDDCLTLTLGFSGCDSDHEIQLVTDGAVAESFPVQVHFKLHDLNPQLCEAYFEKSYSYDLDELDDLLGDEPSARLVFPVQGTEVLWERK